MAIDDSNNNPGRISVSRDALRADLAEMELRLRVYFEAQLQAKADRHDVTDLATRVALLESQRVARDRGEFTPALERAIDARIEQATVANSATEWSKRERVMAVLSVLTAAAMLALSVLLALHGGVLL